MVLFPCICIGLGMMPGPLYALLPYKVDYVPYTASHVVSQLQLLLFSGLAFFLMLGWLKRTLTITLDVDWFYRRLGRNLGRGLDDATGRAWQWLVGAVSAQAPGASTTGFNGTMARKACSGGHGRPALWPSGRR